jgi:lysophospholipid hydrolase
MVADANSDTMISRESYAQINESNLGEYERVLLGLPSRPKIELVLVHPTRNCSSGLAQSWLEPRPWITQHHHVMMTKNVPIVEGNSLDERQRRRRQSRLAVPDLVNRPGSNASNYNHGQNANVDLEDDHSVEDIARMARRVLGNSIGLVLGGGGARGIAHLGVIKAFIDAGVPIDVIGGTSIGALVGGLYSRDANSDTSQALLAWFSSRLSSWWRVCYEMTYPFCGWTTGAGFNRCIWRLFERRCIEDMWVPFFCVSTDITRSCMRIHREGLGWRCIRASMTISGFLPPLWDANDDGSGSLLLDGVYVNNLPADVLARDFDYVGTIIAVDVGSELNESNEPIEDEQSGLWLLLKSISGQRVHVPSLADMQNRLAYIACEEGIRRVKEAAEDPESRVHYIRPPVQRFSAMGFGQFQEILKEGEAYGLEIIGKWRADGTLSRIKGITEGNPVNAAGTAASLSLGHFEAMQRRKSMRHSL